ncbi:Myosin head motor domain [Arabidopsis suecica]|uniref:Myosin head motor domain n=1 Tax=Arabidopsis suecica TaxID=45249 RepID=A0A8T1YIY2_ARASU|nr:Myosin head motor domain [Arabidopsis suecica]
MMKSSVKEILESLRQLDASERFKEKSSSLPSPSTFRAPMPLIRQSLPAKFRNAISPERETIEKEDKDWSIEQITQSPYTAEKEKTENEVVKISTAQMSPAKNSHDPEWINNAEYFIREKLCVWCRVANGQWHLGKIHSTSSDDVCVMLSTNDDVVKVSMEEIFPANPEILEGVEDLTQLSYLNEPSLLYNLRVRYSQDLIYSKAGPVLIAVNPFKNVQIYGEEFLSAYQTKGLDAPHVYAVADAAYDEMMREEKNQSIIISGESGAGKTETAKYAMQYLEALGGGSFGVENEILKTNCILEAFGNAKTSRNDNSSRFGKLMEIHFSAKGKICGSKLETFLLEKSRVAQLCNGERSYHIFYQLCAGASPILKERLKLKAASEYNYLNQSNCLIIDRTDDAQKFHKLMEAFNIVQIPQEYQERAFALLAAVLWLGNVSFKVTDNENHVEVVADEAVTNVAMLMGCNSKELMVVLSTCKLQAGRDCIAKRLTLRQATDMRDSLAKIIYASLFNWLVEQINISLEVGNSRTGRSISILDIYGFESFENNSFEQFCINFANERLQQHFNRHLFKLEQEEYEGDGIDWTKVEFKDNQECLNLIEKKPIGLVSLLDEESNFPKATDTTFANKLKQHLNANSCFKGERGRGFRIKHYAGEVLYNTNGFLDKNRDPLHVDLIQLLSSCKCQLLNLFSTKMRHEFLKPATFSDSMNQSVITKFKGQLFKLMNKLDDTTPHFIRCIKPNSNQLPGLYEENHVLQQLRCCGVLEIVRISRSGYPTRLTHQELAVRYGCLLLDTRISQDPLSTSNAILKQCNLPPEMYQVGYTKIYLRTGLIGVLEERRNYVLRGILGLQKQFRGYQTRECFHNMRNAAVILQSYIRGENARRNYIVVEESAIASTAITEELDAAIHLQYMVRKWLARKHLNSMQQKKKPRHEKKKQRRKSTRRVSEDKDLLSEQFQVEPCVLADLQSRVQKVEAAIMQKEDENTALQEELQRFEERWLENETRMKLMEETWQKHMSSMQISLAAACKILATDKTASHGNDSEDTMSFGTPTKELKRSLSDVNNLSTEFDQRSVIIHEDTKSLVEVNSQSSSRKQRAEELRRLKLRFEKWKKDYKARLRETKARIRLNGDEGRHRNWWCKKSC